MKVKINIEMYSMTVVVVTTFEEFKRLDDAAEKEYEFTTSSLGNCSYILVSNLWGDMYDYRFVSCLSHELNHAAMYTLNRAGVKFDFENQECLCYLQDFLMSRMFKAIKKDKAKGSR